METSRNHLILHNFKYQKHFNPNQGSLKFAKKESYGNLC